MPVIFADLVKRSMTMRDFLFTRSANQPSLSVADETENLYYFF